MSDAEELGRQPASLFEARAFDPFDPGPASISDQAIDRTYRGSGRFSQKSSRSQKRGRYTPTVIIEKSFLFRAGLTHILAGGRFRVTADCSTLCDLPERAFNGKQCLALIGVDNDGPGAVLSQISSLKGQNGALRIIVLTDQFRREELLATVEAGADGYLVKNEITPEALLQSLELVLLGGVVIPHGLSRMLKDRVAPLNDTPAVTELMETGSNGAQPRLADDAPQSADLARLSNREQMILMQLMQGASNKHIARELNIAEATVKVHVKSLLRKTRVNNRTQAAMWGTDHFRKFPDEPVLTYSPVGNIGDSWCSEE
jgi:two-component system, NarL family, nitrate/nitrite response regulator NarL